MERDFELEYRELKQNETPDLWNRIEAGLSEKKIAAVPLENESKSIDIERFVVKKQAPWKRWGLLAAACLCFVIIFPAVMAGLIGSSKSSSRADTASGTADMNTSSSAAASSEPAEAFDTASGHAAAEEGKAEPEYTESAGANGENADAGSMAGGSETAASEDAETSEEAEAEAMMPELTDGQILEGSVVQILQVDETGEETVYQAIVLEGDTDAVMESGMQIELICNDETQYDFVREPREEKGLKKEEIYEVSLQYEQDRLVVLTAAKKN